MDFQWCAFPPWFLYQVNASPPTGHIQFFVRPLLCSKEELWATLTPGSESWLRTTALCSRLLSVYTNLSSHALSKSWESPTHALPPPTNVWLGRGASICCIYVWASLFPLLLENQASDAFTVSFQCLNHLQLPKPTALFQATAFTFLDPSSLSLHAPTSKATDSQNSVPPLECWFRTLSLACLPQNRTLVGL